MPICSQNEAIAVSGNCLGLFEKALYNLKIMFYPFPSIACAQYDESTDVFKNSSNESSICINLSEKETTFS